MPVVPLPRFPNHIAKNAVFIEVAQVAEGVGDIAGPMSVIYTYFAFVEFISADGKELESFNADRNYFGDAALVEYYRTQRTRPALMLPTEALKRWQSLPCFDRLAKALEVMSARDAAANRPFLSGICHIAPLLRRENGVG